MTDQNFPQPPAWFVDACEGARDAHNAWEAAEADLAPLSAANAAAIQAIQGKGRWEGTPGDARMVPSSGVTTSELEALRRATTDTATALAEGHHKVKSAYNRFDGIVRARDGRNSDRRRRLAADVALARHTEAATAWGIAEAALDARDVAYRLAGAPGPCWELSAYATRGQATDFAKQASTHVARRLDGFPVRDVADVAKEV